MPNNHARRRTETFEVIPLHQLQVTASLLGPHSHAGYALSSYKALQDQGRKLVCMAATHPDRSVSVLVFDLDDPPEGIPRAVLAEGRRLIAAMTHET